MWPLAKQTSLNSHPWAHAVQRYSSKSQGSEVWLSWPRKAHGPTEPSLCPRESIPIQRMWQCVPRCSLVTKQVPCSVFLMSEAPPCITSRLAQRENWPGKKEDISHLEIGPYTGSRAPSSHASMNQPLPSPWGKCRQRQIGHMEISALKSNIISKLMTNKIYFCSGLV